MITPLKIMSMINILQAQPTIPNPINIHQTKLTTNNKSLMNIKQLVFRQVATISLTTLIFIVVNTLVQKAGALLKSPIHQAFVIGINVIQ